MQTATTTPKARASNIVPAETIATLETLERKVLWLACWMVHNANHLRVPRDGLKVGGHQSSSASAVTILTALYLHSLRAQDRLAVKPHAAPAFHAIQYLLGRQSRERLEAFRGFGGAQSYPSRTKDTDGVDFSTGSVGLGVGITLFASLVQDYVRLHSFTSPKRPAGRMIALMGDAELDEGNIFEALLEGWKHDVRNLWWIIDYNRHSLDGVVNDYLFQRIQDFFPAVGWQVVSIKYGRKLEAAFEGPAGSGLKDWIDNCPNQLYSALTFKGGGAWREYLSKDLAGTSGVKELLDGHDDDGLHGLMTNLGGHDMSSILSALSSVEDDVPCCFVAYTIKGYRLPLAGHKDNHAGLMTVAQMAEFKKANNVADGTEWELFSGLEMEPRALRDFLANVPFQKRPKKPIDDIRVSVPEIVAPGGENQSTQEAFGKIIHNLGRGNSAIADRLVTASPDVTVSTNLGGWVNQRAVFSRNPTADTFRIEKVASPLKWDQSPRGQHIELGIAENNLFLLLAALGLSHSIFEARLLPIGTLYDPFIARGLDALNYACYQDARFMVVATPSGISLAAEGGAHQSIATPLIGLAQDGLAAFEPSYADELATIMAWAFDYMQRDDGSGDPDQGEAGLGTDWLRDVAGGSVYLRLSTRPLAQRRRVLSGTLATQVIAGGYWLYPPDPGAELAIAYTGAVAQEAQDAFAAIRDEVPGAGLLAVTSADRLNAGWHAAERARQAGHAGAISAVESLLSPLAADAGLVTVIDGHPATLGWLGSVYGHRARALGVEHFGQSGDIVDLFRHHRIDEDAILNAAAAALTDRR